MEYAQTNLALDAQLKARGVGESGRMDVANAYGLAVRLFSNRFRACGRPFVTHLVGTASVIAHHGGDLDSILAGLLHAAYAQGEFGDRESGASRGHRETLRRLVGEAAEGLIASYHETPWPPEDLAGAVERISGDGITEMERRVLMLRIANEYDDGRDLAPLYCGTQRRAAAFRGLVCGAAIAEALGEETLSRELTALQHQLDGAEIPVALRTEREGSHAVDSVRLRERMRREVSRLLPGRGRTR